MKSKRFALLALSISLTIPFACDNSDDGETPCAETEVRLDDGKCVDPYRRYEPDERLDFDNVYVYEDGVIQHFNRVGEGQVDQSFSGGLPTTLEVPEEPKSGFRLVVPSVTLEPYQEVTYCVAWPNPELTHRYIYAAEVHTTAGLHHGNLLGMNLREEGPNPYPNCRPGADDFFSGFLDGFDIPDVLFANSTQVVGTEGFHLPEGYGYYFAAGKEPILNIHLVNPSGDPLKVEVVYDFFTMDGDEVSDEVVPFVYTINDFVLPPQERKSLELTCDFYGGEIVSVMPHMHEWGEGFEINLKNPDGEQENIYDRTGVNMAESDITTFQQPIKTENYSQLQYKCHFYNDTDHPMTYGIGENEMCILFGYVTPPEAQAVGIAPYEGQPCVSAQLGLIRGYDSLDEAIVGLADGDLAVFLDLLGLELEDLTGLLGGL